MKNIYIDESGISKGDGYSTIACIVIVSDTDLTEKIKKIEKDNNIEVLHWKEMSWRVRDKVIRDIVKLPIKARVFVCKNPSNIPKYMKDYLLPLISNENIKNIYIDGKKNRSFKNNFKSGLRANSISTKDLFFVNDEDEPLVRVADIVAGCVRYYYDNQGLGKVENLYRSLKKNIIELEVFKN